MRNLLWAVIFVIIVTTVIVVSIFGPGLVLGALWGETAGNVGIAIGALVLWPALCVTFDLLNRIDI